MILYTLNMCKLYNFMASLMYGYFGSIAFCTGTASGMIPVLAASTGAVHGCRDGARPVSTTATQSGDRAGQDPRTV
jgi:hypothetical protein